MTEETTTESTPALTLEVIASQISKFEVNRVDEIIAAAKQHAESIVANPETADGRETLKSEAYKIAKTKTSIARLANSSIEQAKSVVDTVTKERIRLEKAFDAIRDQIKAPALEWEAKEEKRKAEINEQVLEIREQAMNLDGCNAYDLSQRINEVVRLSGGNFDEFAAAAKDAVDNSIAVLDAALAARKQFESDQLELKRLREETAKRAEEEAARVATEKAAQAKRDAEEAARKAAEEKAAREAQAKREEEAAKVARNLKAIQTLKEWAAPGCDDTVKLKARLESIKEFTVTPERFGDLYGAVVAVYDLARANVESQIYALAAKAVQEAKERADREAKEKADLEAKRAADEAKRIEEAKVKAAEDERKRIEAEQAAKAAEEERNRKIAEAAELARKANEEHRAKVRGEAAGDLWRANTDMSFEVSRTQALEIIAVIESGKIRHTAITF